jgi:TetR/AcrR family transcriptional repressor of lmrAB and yxaGH operons
MSIVIVKGAEALSKDSRIKMVSSAASLIQRRGVNATSFSEVVADSGAPRGSIYHHFPNGKDQLAGDAIKFTLDRVMRSQRGCKATTPQGVLDCFIDVWRQTVIESDATAGCVVAGVAIDSTHEATGLMGLVKSAFREWLDLLAKQLHATGLPKDRARSAAVAALASMEGAMILCRAERSVKPLETVAGELKRLVRAGGGKDRDSA